ncbi:hypothetical protein GPN2_11632 [Streptomyces murinus]
MVKVMRNRHWAIKCAQLWRMRWIPVMWACVASKAATVIEWIFGNRRCRGVQGCSGCSAAGWVTGRTGYNRRALWGRFGRRPVRG